MQEKESPPSFKLVSQGNFLQNRGKSSKIGQNDRKITSFNGLLPHLLKIMHSLDENFFKSLVFTAEQLTILRTIGEYQGKQELYFKQSPEILKGLQQVAIIESSIIQPIGRYYCSSSSYC